MATNPELQVKFDEALGLLSQNKFKEGIDALTAIRDKGYVSSGVEANLGRALVEVGQQGAGLSHLMNAVALSRFDARTREDLKIAQAKVESGLGFASQHPAETANLIASYLRPSEGFSIASLLFLSLLATKVLNLGGRRLRVALGVGFLLILSLSGFSTLSRSVYILTKDAELKSAPLESSDVRQSLKNGTRLRVIRQSGDFYEVERTNSFIGWIKGDFLFRSPY